ncbi:MAG: ABC transporter permease [Myxococcales bacterium]|nr:ABC transporter permease [Myxococcales bacterium]
MTRLLALMKKELIQLRRDRLTMGMMVVLPVMQLLLFGFAIDTDVRHIPTAVYDQDHSAESRDFVRRMEITGFYDVVGVVRGEDEVSRALRSGAASVVVVIPPRFGSLRAAGRPSTVQLVVDGSDPQTVASATNGAAGLASALSTELLVQYLRSQGVPPPPTVRVEPATWYNPELKTAVFIVPGLVGVILTMTMVMLTSMAIARERERGTLEQLVVSPLKSIELVLGKILPYVVIGYVQMTLILTFGHVVFQVPMVGSPVLLYGVASVFIAANLALGLFFSTLAQTQQQAMQMSFFFLLPNILLSGFMFPFDAMPRPAQWLGDALPLTHFLRIVRGITLKGARPADLATEVLSLAVILTVIVALSSLRFRKKVVV